MRDIRPVLPLFAVAVAAAFQVNTQRPPTPAGGSDDNVATTVAGIARNAIDRYQERDRATYLDNLFRLQIAAGDYADAAASIDALLAILPATPSDDRDRLVAYQLFATVKAQQPASDGGFAEAFQQAFRDKVRTLDDKAAFHLLYWFILDVDAAAHDFRNAFARQQGQADPSVQDAIALARRYVLYTVFRDIQPLTGALIAEDDSRRYVVQDDLAIRTPDGATISGFLVRPRRAAGPLPAAFTFTIYASSTVPHNARRAAAYGYAGVVAFTRGKGRSPDEPIPYEHDGSDARAVIDWIARQPWSNGSVGMFGGATRASRSGPRRNVRRRR